MRNLVALIALCLFVLACAGISQAAEPARRKLVAIEVDPPDVHLNTLRDHQALIVQAHYDDGITGDVTGRATFTLSSAEPVQLQGNRLLPKADGECKLTVAYQGLNIEVPVVVKDATTDRAVSFRLDRDAGLYEVGLQHGQLPRSGQRQRRVPAVAVRL